MLLTDRQIRAAVEDGELEISPFEQERLQPVSYDVALGPQVRLFSQPGLVDTARIEPGHTSTRWIGPSGFWLQPGEFMLAHTVEAVGLAGTLAARVEGKSSLGRLGLMVHVTAGFIDPGFYGQITLEVVNLLRQPIRLYAGMPIAQLCFTRLTEAPERLYGQAGNHYQGQTGPTESRYRL